jgi:hypothetical protein
VYLGRVSYALYVIQLTPLGRGLMYRLIPAGTAWFGLLLYLGMTVVSALLYELVEEPARRLVLRMWPSGRARHAKAPEPMDDARRRGATAWALILVTAVAALLQTAAWAGGRVTSRRGPPTLAESQRATRIFADRVVVLPVSRLERRAQSEGIRYRVPIPETWMIGAHNDRRAPPSLLVYADGQAITFERRSIGQPSPATAHLRGPRTTFVELLLVEGAEPNRVTLVRHDPLTAGMLLAQRISASFSLLGVIAAAVAAAGVSAGFSFRGWRPALDAAAASALAACVLFVALEIHLRSWAPVVMAIELIALCAVARFSRRPAGARAV